MISAAGLRQRAGRLGRLAPFEIVVVGVALVYVGFQFSPSSYSLALAQLGESVSPWVGVPQPIRSDEWAILTPLFQAAVNNDFHQVNETSFYGEDLLSIFGLPLFNWGLIFKPQLWLFFVVSASFAYSFYWASMAALMLVGWSVLLRTFGFSKTSAGLISTLLFFSPFVQAWWTIFHSQLAFFPWILLAIVGVKSSIRTVAALALLIPVWWISFFYVPGIPPLLFLGIVLCVAFHPEILTWRRITAVLGGGAVGVGITLLYFRPILSAYANSVFPGQRWVEGGALPDWLAASQFLPGTTTEGYTNLIGSNISEVSTVASWLPVLALCTIDVGAVRSGWSRNVALRRDLRRIGTLAIGWGVLTLWQVASLAGPLSYAFGFGLSPEQRTLFGSGAFLVIAAGYAIERLPIRLTARRLGFFSLVVVCGWLAASVQLQPSNVLVPRDELIVLVPIIALFPFLLVTPVSNTLNARRTTITVLAVVPVVAGWGLFNPVQRTDVIFEKPDTEVTRSLDALAQERGDHAIAAPGFSGGVLNGIGYRSVSHIIPTPSPHLFKKYFPTMDEGRFNTLFNRYENVGLADVDTPTLLTPDYIQLPLKTMSQYAASP